MNTGTPDPENLIPMSRVAKVMGWTQDGARRWVRKNNCGVKIGSRLFLTKEKLLANFPGLVDSSEDLEDYTTCRPVPSGGGRNDT